MIKAVPKPKQGGFNAKGDRCVGCGHPLTEHRPLLCTVPRCKCLEPIKG